MTTTLLSVRMTPEEKARLESEASHAGMKLSAYVRKQLLGSPGKVETRTVRGKREFHPATSAPEDVSAARAAEVEDQGGPSEVVRRLLAQQKAARR